VRFKRTLQAGIASDCFKRTFKRVASVWVSSAWVSSVQTSDSNVRIKQTYVGGRGSRVRV